MRLRPALVPLVSAAALAVPAVAHADASSTVGDPSGDAPSGHDITSAYYTTAGSGVGMSVKVRDLSPTGRVRLTVSPLTDQAFQYDVIRYQGRVYTRCYSIDYSRSGTAQEVSCKGVVDHFSYDLKTDRVAIVVKEGAQFDPAYGPYTLQGFAVRATGTAFDTVASRTLKP